MRKYKKSNRVIYVGRDCKAVSSKNGRVRLQGLTVETVTRSKGIIESLKAIVGFLMFILALGLAVGVPTMLVH